MENISFDLPAYEGFVPEIRTIIRSIARDFCFDDQEAYEIVLVVDEVCNNAIEHGRKGRNKNVKLECKFDQQKVEITVQDSGCPQFNVEKVLKHAQELLEERTAKPMMKGGLGLIIVQKYVDSLNIISSSQGTKVKIMKRCHKDSGTGYQMPSSQLV